MSAVAVTTRYQPLGLSPSPATPIPPNPPPQLSWAWTATQPTTSATPDHHCPSPPPATTTTGISPAITAVTATSALALAITPPMTATSAPALAIPGTFSTAAATSAPAPATSGTLPAHAETSIMHYDHASPLTQPHMPRSTSAHLLTTLPLYVSAFPEQDLPHCMICLNLHCCLAQSPGLTLSPGTATCHQDLGLSPGAY
ncbi:hypothetical protein C0993_006868 [Termitomyces sp. T159_Od127]|nr:hypothetical protein C0993_006868 [Termitomyces sp. T159_Od127]